MNEEVVRQLAKRAYEQHYRNTIRILEEKRIRTRNIGSTGFASWESLEERGATWVTEAWMETVRFVVREFGA